MNIDILDGLIRRAMLSKQPTILSVLRGLKAEYANMLSAKGRKGKPLTKDEGYTVIRRHISQREQSMREFAAGGRQDRADAEEREKAILEALLPVPLTAEEIGVIAALAVTSTNATCRADIKTAIAKAVELADGRAPTKVLSQLISAKLNNEQS